MKAKPDPIFNQQQVRFSRSVLDQLKENDLRTLFQTLMTEPSHRTIADVNTLIKIMLNLGPIKKLRNSSIVYHLCRSMFIAKFKEKKFIYQQQEDAESIYIILNGKVGLYKRNPEFQEQEQVIFLSEGSCFGNAYKWKQRFLPLSFQQSLLAVIPKRQLPKISQKLILQNEEIIKSLSKTRIFGSYENVKQMSGSLTLHRVPFGSYLIKEGQIPKGLFFILKGTVSKLLQINKKQKEQGDISKEKQHLSVAQYAVGDYFPKQKLSQCLPFSIIAQSPCEVVSIPKRCLRQLGWSNSNSQSFKGQKYYKEELSRNQEWQQYKKNYLYESISFKESKPKPMIF